MAGREEDLSTEENPPSTVTINKAVLLAGLAALIFVGALIIRYTSGGEEEGAAPERFVRGETPRQERQSFLEDPPQDPFAEEGGQPQNNSSWVRTDSAQESAPVYPARGARQAYGEEGYGNGQYVSGPPSGGGANGDKEKDPEEEAYQKALTSTRITVLGGDNSSNASGGRDESAESERRGAEDEGPFGEYMNSYMEAMSQRGQPRQGQPASQGQASRESGPTFEERVSASRDMGQAQGRLQEPASSYVVPAGYRIPALLETGINSQLRGSITALVTRDVYDQHQRYVLIPKGSKLLGLYDENVIAGQDRLLVSWTRLRLPDGRYRNLDGFDAQGLNGMTGLNDQVDNHFWETFGGAAMLSVVGAGLQLSQPRGSGGFGRQQDPQQVMAAQVGREFSRVATEMIRSNMNREPTITIRPGFRFAVYVKQDLPFSGPWQAPQEAARFRSGDVQIPAPTEPPRRVTYADTTR